jgi:hypothetical protein
VRFSRPFFMALAGALAAVAPVVPAGAQTAEPDRLSWNLDARMGYYSLSREERSGATTSRADFRSRVRPGALLRLSSRWAVKVRLAGRFSTDQDSVQFYVRDHAPTIDGLRMGEATIDEAQVQYHAPRWSLRVGRLQTKHALADLQGKSIDRGDSPNTDVTWTDGAHLTWLVGSGWRSHLIVQHNAPEGPSNVLRSPLAFSDARVTLFAALEGAQPWGRLVQRSVDLTFIPGALQVDGASEDYLAIVARASLAWSLGTERGRFSLGAELGYAPNTPSRVSLRLPETGDTWVGGTAVQVGLTLADLVPAHRIGFVYGRTEAGWLISPDFRNNDRLLEGRYQWAFTRNHSLEARLRHRQDLEQLVTAMRKRHDLDFYLRITSRF